MRSKVIACALFLGAVTAAPAFANMCLSDTGRRCPTGMPVDGYCMCGNEGGTVVASSAQKSQQRAPAPDARMSRPAQQSN